MQQYPLEAEELDEEERELEEELDDFEELEELDELRLLHLAWHCCCVSVQPALASQVKPVSNRKQQ